MNPQPSPGSAFAVLHASFALTGVLHAIGGALLPALALAFVMSDARSGALFFLYYAGTAIGALLCIGRYARIMAAGFFLVAVASIAITLATRNLLPPLFLLFGIGVGVPMTSVSIFAGRVYGRRSAAPLTFLNFSWSIGALLAPLIAARLLLHHSWRAPYFVLAAASLLASLACLFLLREPSAAPAPAPSPGLRNLRLIALFSILAFLEVGVENIASTWLATYAMRSSASGPAQAAATSSLYWFGFLASRGLFSLLLLRLPPAAVLRSMVVVAALSSALLIGLPAASARSVAMFALGAAFAPIFPLIIARFFARARNASDSRWVLSICGFGGSVMPWLTGALSSATGSLRLGLLTVPAELLLILALLPAALARDPAAGSQTS
jgi:fucose permease